MLLAVKPLLLPDNLWVTSVPTVSRLLVSRSSRRTRVRAGTRSVDEALVRSDAPGS
jgi:hypothetical protein